MNAATTPHWTWRDTLGVYVREAAHQFRTVLRTPGFALPTLLFPTMFYVFFGLLFGKGGDGHVATFMLASYGTFGIMAPALFGFGVGVAMERERGILAMKRVAPMPPLAYLFAKAAMAMSFALAIVSILFALGAGFGGVRLPASEWVGLALALVLGSLPFCALGLVVGVRASGQASAAIVNLIYLPMSFLAGLWVPLQFMPHWLQEIATVLPTYHLSQLALGIIHMDTRGSFTVHLVYLAAFTLACLALAVHGWRRIRDR
jgi:ABC-2 type transport system permease protein